MQTTYKINILPLGFNRLSIVALVKELVVFHSEKLEDALINSNIIYNILVLKFIVEKYILLLK